MDEILQAVCTGDQRGARLPLRLASISSTPRPARSAPAPPSAGASTTRRSAPRRPSATSPRCSTRSSRSRAASCSRPRRRARASPRHDLRRPSQNGRGPHAWDHHWLLVPLRSRGGGELRGADLGRRARGSARSRRATRSRRCASSRTRRRPRSSRAAQFEEVRFLADHDPLTRLFNRRTYMSELESELDRAQRYGHGFALVLCDLDGFKKINDTHGHLAGDAALQRFAAVARATACARRDRAFRIGGDEFALLLVARTGEEAEEAIAPSDRCARGRRTGRRRSAPASAAPSTRQDGKTATRAHPRRRTSGSTRRSARATRVAPPASYCGPVPGCVALERDALGALAAVGVAERRERLLVEARADRRCGPIAVVAVAGSTSSGRPSTR